MRGDHDLRFVLEARFLTDDGDAIVVDELARLGQLAIAARLSCHIDDDTSRLHRFNNILRIFRGHLRRLMEVTRPWQQYRRTLARYQGSRDDNVDVAGLCVLPSTDAAAGLRPMHLLLEELMLGIVERL